MELGEKLRLARQEAGLSQRQLCGDVITRNMLSLIEHGTAQPSMDTLRYLAERLGKPMSWFLEEDVVVSANQELMAQAKQKWARGEVQAVWRMLKEFQPPDPVLEWEWKYLSALALLAFSEIAVREGRIRYARQLLEEAQLEFPELDRQRLLQLGRIEEADLVETVKNLPSLDEELLLRAEAALVQKQADRALALLAAAEDRQTPRWNLLEGRALVLQERYDAAADCLEQAETAYPEQCWPLLEICFRELKNFEKAYLYACRQR